MLINPRWVQVCIEMGDLRARTPYVSHLLEYYGIKQKGCVIIHKELPFDAFIKSRSHVTYLIQSETR